MHFFSTQKPHVQNNRRSVHLLKISHHPWSLNSQISNRFEVGEGRAALGGGECIHRPRPAPPRHVLNLPDSCAPCTSPSKTIRSKITRTTTSPGSNCIHEYLSMLEASDHYFKFKRAFSKK